MVIGGGRGAGARWPRSSSCCCRTDAAATARPTSPARSASTRAPTCASSACAVGEVRTVTAAGRPRARRLRLRRQVQGPGRRQGRRRLAVGRRATATCSSPRVLPAARALADGAHIPLRAHGGARSSSTASSPASTTSTSRSGPKGANKNGALSRLLAGRRRQPRRRGRQHQPDGDRPVAGARRRWPTARTTCSARSATCRCSPPRWPSSDDQVAAFNTDLASVADQLAGERGELALALKNLAIALGEVASFVKENRANLTTDITGLADITGTLAKQKDAIGEVLEAGPVRCRTCRPRLQRPSGHARHPRQRPAARRPGRCSSARCSPRLGQPKSVCDQHRQGARGSQVPPSPATRALAAERVERAPDLTLGGILRRAADDGRRLAGDARLMAVLAGGLPDRAARASPTCRCPAAPRRAATSTT